MHHLNPIRDGGPYGSPSILFFPNNYFHFYRMTKILREVVYIYFTLFDNILGTLLFKFLAAGVTKNAILEKHFLF